MEGFTHPLIEKLSLDVANDDDIERVVEQIAAKEGRIGECFSPLSQE